RRACSSAASERRSRPATGAPSSSSCPGWPNRGRETLTAIRVLLRGGGSKGPPSAATQSSRRSWGTTRQVRPSGRASDLLFDCRTALLSRPRQPDGSGELSYEEEAP